MTPIRIFHSRVVAYCLDLGWLKDRAGVTALEYGILASILGLELVNVFHGLGVSLTSLFVKVGQGI